MCIEIMLSYFECGLCTGAAVLTAEHQKRLHSQDCVLLQLYDIWGGEIHTLKSWHTSAKTSAGGVNVSSVHRWAIGIRGIPNIGHYLLRLTFFWTGNGDVGKHYDPMSGHCQVAVVTAFLCQFNQVSEPGGNRRATWEEFLRGKRISSESFPSSQ